MQVAGIACLCTNMDVFGSGTVNRTVNGMGLPRYQRSNKKLSILFALTTERNLIP
jgi:hypothetical protein